MFIRNSPLLKPLQRKVPEFCNNLHKVQRILNFALEVFFKLSCFFDFSGSAASMFHLNSSTGVLKLQTKWPTFTTDYSVLLTINITTKQRRSTIFTLMLFKRRPSTRIAFQSSTYFRAINENNNPGIPLEQIRITSLPPGDSVVRYYIVDGNDGNHFKIDDKSGEIIIRDSLDFENIEGGEFCLKVYAIDLIDNSTASTKVWVIVNNLNDNSPRFQHDGDILEAWVPENTVNPLVYRVETVDLDVGDNVT